MSIIKNGQIISRRDAVNGLKACFKTDEARAACLAGAALVAFIVGKDGELLFQELVTESDDAAKISALQARVRSRIFAERKAEREEAEGIFCELKSTPDKLNAAIADIRAIITQVRAGTDGRTYDENGNLTDDEMFETIPNVTPSAPPSETVIILKDGLTFTVTRDEDAYLEAAIKIDASKNPKTIYRYAISVAIENGKDVGPACFMRDAIVEAAKNSGFPEFSGSCNDLLKMVENGSVSCMSHIVIGSLKVLAKLSDAEIQQFDNDTLDRYLNWIKILGAPNPVIKDAALDTFIDERGRALEGIDDNGNIISGSTNTTAYRRRFLLCLAEKSAQRLLMALVANNMAVHPKKVEIIQIYNNIVASTI